MIFYSVFLYFKAATVVSSITYDQLRHKDSSNLLHFQIFRFFHTEIELHLDGV